jgi:RNA polymerase-binding transcription factor DksA
MPNLSHADPSRSAALDQRLPLLRSQLRTQRQFRLDQLAALEAQPHPLDEVSQALTDAAISVLTDIDIALMHIDLGDYGHCRQCLVAEIPLEWLMILPTAALCPDCLNAAIGPDPSR